MSRAIFAVDGVKSVQVSFENKTAEVETASCDSDVAAAIADALSASGYGGEVIETAPGS